MSRSFSLHRSILLIVALACGGILLAVQYTTLERLKTILIADPESGAYQSGLAQRVWAMWPMLQPIDWILLGSLLAVLLAVLVVELRTRRVGAELSSILESERGALVLIAVLAVSFSRFYLAPGEFALGDGPTHVTRTWAAAESISQRHWPSWSFFNYAGFPLLQFYGPAFYVLAGGLTVISGDLVWSTKLLLFLLHVASAFPVYAWARTAGMPRQGAFIAAMASVLSFLHTHTVVWTGALPVALTYVLFPCVLWALEHALKTGAPKRLAILALSVAALVGTHHGYAAAALEFAALYVVVRFLLAGRARPPRRHLAPVVLAVLGGVLVSGGPVLRIVQEGSWVHLESGVPFGFPAVPDRQFLKDILVWRNTWTGWTTAYIGGSVIAFACIGTWLAFRRIGATPDTPGRRSVAIVAVFALLCAAGSGRLINLALPWIALAAGGVSHLAARRNSPRTLLVLLALLLLDLGPTTFQSLYRSDRGWLTEGLRSVARAVAPHRTLVGFTSPGGTQFFHWGAYGDTDLIVPTGYFPQGAPQSLASITALVDAMNDPGFPSPAREDLLYLWDVAALVTHSRSRFTTTGQPPFTAVQPASPLIFSRQAAIVRDDSLYALQGAELEMGHTAREADRQRYLARIGPWVRAMRIDHERADARVLFVADPAERRTAGSRSKDSQETLRSLPAASDPAAFAADANERADATGADASVEADFEVTRYEVRLREVTITYRTRDPGYVRAAFSWYPTLRVLVDGVPATPWRSLLGAIVIPSEAGEHTIRLVPASPWRTRSWIIALAGVLVVASSMFIARRSRTVVVG